MVEHVRSLVFFLNCINFLKTNGMPVHPMKTPNVAGIDRIETRQLLTISDPFDSRYITRLFVWLW